MQNRLQSLSWSAAAFVGLLFGHSPCAHAQSVISGTWLIRYEHQSHNQHSTAPAPVQVVQGRLTLRQTGDSLFGEWQTVPAQGDSAQPARTVYGVQRRDSTFLRFAPIVDNEAGIFANAVHEFVEFIKTYVHGMPPTTTALDFAMQGNALSGIRRTVLLDGTPRSTGEVLTGIRTVP